VTDAELAAIVGIGGDASLRNAEDLSMEKALRRTRYRELRGELSHESLAAALRGSPQAVEQWVTYSQDKRTNRGWALEPEACRIHRPDHANSNYTFASLPDAVAAYVIHELDYWSGRATEWT
jgi:hypothetical protein